MSTTISGDTGVSAVQDNTITLADLSSTLLLYIQGVSIGPVNYAVSSLLTISHTLGSIPSDIRLNLRCKTAELGYSIGDVIEFEPTADVYASSVGASVMSDAANVYVRVAPIGCYIVNKSTYAVNVITPANWEIIGRVWK